MFALAEVSKIRCQLKTPTDEPSNFVFLSIWTFLIQSDCVKHKMIAPRQGLTERAPLGADNHILEAPSGVKELNIYRDCYLGTNHSRILATSLLPGSRKPDSGEKYMPCISPMINFISNFENGQNDHYQACHQWSPRVAKVQGGP